ncbi:MAG TPA: penicillin-binding transpeptidase domain-containing protein, partial [Gemmatimonadaceae bacterium]|nr:penicillin-binding transpeptidase domain-containing protein [Gemmatimonadaceae bacterium]
APNAGMSAPSPYFVDAVKDIIERAGVPLSAGGYRVYTTLDPALERAATDALVNGTARVEARGDYRHPKFNPAAPQNSDYLQGMVVAVDAATGDVRALVGGRNYSASPFDRAVDGVRQPGSSFKPFVYAKALEDGIPPNAIVPDTALAIPLPNGDIYKPRDDDGKYLGPMTIRDALVGSRNSVAVQLGQMVGMDSVAALAARLGIQTPIRPFPSSAIGATELHPLELVSAYTAFATNGQVVAPRMVMRVEDRTGRVVFGQPPSDPRQVLDPRVAFIVRDMMREVVTRGTGVAARRGVPEGVPIAGKTGTTNDNVDVWFVGMTPQLVAGVWMGFDKPRPIALHVAGGSLAAPVWAEMMSRYYATRSAGQFPAPGGLVLAELDRTSGRLAAPGSPADQQYLEFFLPGTEPAAMRGNPWNVAQWGALLGH